MDCQPGHCDIHDFLDAVIDNIPHMIFIKEAEDLRFVRFNRAAEDLLGYSRHDLIGKNDYDFFPKEEADFFTAKDREVLRSGKMLEIPEEPIHTKAGLRHLHTRKIPLCDAAGNSKFLLGISVDITDRKRAEYEERLRLTEINRQHLEKVNEQLRKNNEELERFAYVASHDLQEPLRKIQAFGGILIEEHAAELSPEAVGYINSMQRSAWRMSELVSDLLSYSRASRNQEDLNLISLNQVMEQVLWDLDEQVRQKGAKIEVGDLPEIAARSTQMRQLFQNLIQNALIYVDKSRVPEVKVQTHTGDDFVEIAVSDNGIGVAPEYFVKIFEPFQRLHRHEEYEGTGMGLAICKKIVDQYGGALQVQSQPGQGCCFTVRLPLRQKHRGST